MSVAQAVEQLDDSRPSEHVLVHSQVLTPVLREPVQRTVRELVSSTWVVSPLTNRMLWCPSIHGSSEGLAIVTLVRPASETQRGWYPAPSALPGSKARPSEPHGPLNDTVTTTVESI